MMVNAGISVVTGIGTEKPLRVYKVELDSVSCNSVLVEMLEARSNAASI
jgi:hypothetical protein